MTYNALEPTVLDRVRGLVGDIGTEELLPDETYTSVIARFTNWKRAAAEMALRVARVIEDDPSRVDDISWSQRTKSLYELRTQLLAEADVEDAAIDPVDVPIVAPYMEIVPGPTW